MRTMRPFLKEKQLKLFFWAFINPYMDYGALASELQALAMKLVFQGMQQYRLAVCSSVGKEQPSQRINVEI